MVLSGKVFKVLVVILASWGSVLGSTLEHMPPMEQRFVLQDNEASSAENPVYRLNIDYTVNLYELKIQPYLLSSEKGKQFTFDGSVAIHIKANSDSKTLTLHTKDLTITKSEYWLKEPSPETKTLKDSKLNTITDIRTYDNVNFKKGKEYVLYFEFSGEMSDDMHGFYRSSYTDSANVTKWLGSTQFQTHHARRVFPCFDEPQYKAEFQLEITRHKSFKTLSNTRLMKSVTEGDYIIDTYARTPRMSTYILAFTISEFNERSNGDFGVSARPEFYLQTEYAFNVGMKILAKLDDYLGVKYYGMGVDKMHMAAIPDFAAGAMENWGLLTYRERALLYEEGSTTLTSKQSIAAIIAHEQAHMWFGNFVTCKWWSYTWLNEGFARYFQYFATAMVETDFELDKQFVVDQIHSVMQMDATNSTNPMTNDDTNSPRELRRMFNSISYNKGASFVRMIKHSLGEEKFRQSLKEYLNKHGKKNTMPRDLFDIWEKIWNSESYPLSSAMDIFKSFTTQVGYPVITFDLINSTTMIVTQKRFLLRKNDGSDGSLKYVVPISYTTDVELDFNNTSPKFILQNKDNVMKTVNRASWIIANIQQTGYYRVNYNRENWLKIGQYLNHSENLYKIHELNRAQIVDDLFNLARAGEIEYNITLQVLEYLKYETHYLPWTAAFNGLNYIVNRLGTNKTALSQFSSYIQEITNKTYTSLGFNEKPTDRPLDIYNRAKILSWMCKYNNTHCIETAKSYFQQNLDTNPVPVNIRSVVYCVAMREGNLTDFEKMYQKFKKETGATEITLLLSSMGCVREKTLVQRYFHIIMSNDVRKQDKEAALNALYTQNPENIEMVFDLLVANLNTSIEVLGESFLGQSTVAATLSTISAGFTTADQLDKLNSFIGEQKNGVLKNSIEILEKAAKTVAENLRWDNETLVDFQKYIDARKSTSYGLRSSGILLITGLIATLFTRLKNIALL